MIRHTSTYFQNSFSVFPCDNKIAIAFPLQEPSAELEDLYGHFAIVAIRDASYFFAGTVGCMLIPRVVIWVAQEFCTIDVVELDDLSSGAGPSNLLL